jgi:hypothetical protein
MKPSSRSFTDHRDPSAQRWGRVVSTVTTARSSQHGFAPACLVGDPSQRAAGAFIGGLGGAILGDQNSRRSDY